MAIPITANLGAMMEYEERRRVRLNDDKRVRIVEESQDLHFASLPPPPRGPRKGRSRPSTPKEAQHSTHLRKKASRQATSRMNSDTLHESSPDPESDTMESSGRRSDNPYGTLRLQTVGSSRVSSSTEAYESTSFPISVVDSSFKPSSATHTRIPIDSFVDRSTVVGPKDDPPAASASRPQQPVKKSFLKSPLNLFSIGGQSESNQRLAEELQTGTRERDHSPIRLDGML